MFLARVPQKKGLVFPFFSLYFILKSDSHFFLLYFITNLWLKKSGFKASTDRICTLSAVAINFVVYD